MKRLMVVVALLITAPSLMSFEKPVNMLEDYEFRYHNYAESLEIMQHRTLKRLKAQKRRS